MIRSPLGKSSKPSLPKKQPITGTNLKKGGGVKREVGNDPKGGRPTYEFEQKEIELMEEYRSKGVTAMTCYRELNKKKAHINEKTIRKYYRMMLDKLKEGLADTWVDEQRDQKALTMDQLDRDLLELEGIKDTLYKAIDRHEKLEDKFDRLNEEYNEELIKRNKILKEAGKPPLIGEDGITLKERSRARTYPHALINKLQTIIKEIANLKIGKATIAMEPTAGEEIDEIFRKHDEETKKLMELETK